MPVEHDTVLGFDFLSASPEEAAEAVVARASSTENRPVVVSTINAQFAVLAREQEDFRRAIQASTFRVPDGMSLVWAGRITGHPLKSRITGREMFVHLVRAAAERGWSVFLLGDTDEVLRQTVERLHTVFPALRISGTISPPFPFFLNGPESERIVAEIRRSKSDVVFVALGAPKQEVWIAKTAMRLDTKLVMGVGGAFRMFAGLMPVAPDFWQRLGLEWFWRLIHEPKRLLARYTIGNAKFAWLVLKEMSRSIREKR